MQFHRLRGGAADVSRRVVGIRVTVPGVGVRRRRELPQPIIRVRPRRIGICAGRVALIHRADVPLLIIRIPVAKEQGIIFRPAVVHELDLCTSALAAVEQPVRIRPVEQVVRCFPLDLAQGGVRIRHARSERGAVHRRAAAANYLNKKSFTSPRASLEIRLAHFDFAYSLK